MTDASPPPWEQRARRMAEAGARRPAASRRALVVAWLIDVGLVLAAGLAGDVGLVVAVVGWVAIAALLAPRQFRTGALPPRYTEVYLQMWVIWAVTHVGFLAVAVPRFTGLPEWVVPLALIVPAPLAWAWLRLRRRLR